MSMKIQQREFWPLTCDDAITADLHQSTFVSDTTHKQIQLMFDLFTDLKKEHVYPYNSQY